MFKNIPHSVRDKKNALVIKITYFKKFLNILEYLSRVILHLTNFFFLKFH